MIEIAIIAGLVILLFGASRIPKLARNLGEGIGEFKRGREKEPEQNENSTEREVELEQ